MLSLKVEGTDELNAELSKLKSAYGKSNKAAVVSFGTNYGVYVHENMNVHHEVGEAKFLENAVKANIPAVSGVVEKMTSKGMNLSIALFTAASIIQRDAQKRCPVDIGNLKASARTEMEPI